MKFAESAPPAAMKAQVAFSTVWPPRNSVIRARTCGEL